MFGQGCFCYRHDRTEQNVHSRSKADVEKGTEHVASYVSPYDTQEKIKHWDIFHPTSRALSFPRLHSLEGMDSGGFCKC